MRQKTLWIVAGCVLAVLGLRPASSFGEAPAGYKIIYTFTGGSDGGVPFSDLTVDAAGNLYGTTSGGGTGRGGTVFELHRTKDGWKEEVLYNFGSVQGDGGYPQGGVIFDKAGDLYGTTAGGGSGNNTGTVFKLSRSSNGHWTEKILYSFTGENGDGQNPQTDLTFDAHGNLYGTAPLGGDLARSMHWPFQRWLRDRIRVDATPGWVVDGSDDLRVYGCARWSDSLVSSSS